MPGSKSLKVTKILDKYESAVKMAHARAFPELSSLPVECRPIIDLELGDLGTELPVLVAAEIREKAQDVGERIKSELSPELASRASVVSGYLNFSLSLEELAEFEDLRPAANQEPLVVMGAKPSGVGEVGLLRLLSSALCQYGLLRSLGYKPSILLGSGGRPAVSGAATSCVLELMDSIRASEEVPLEFDLAVRGLFQSKASSKTIWIHPDFIPRSEFRNFCARAEESGARLFVRCLDRAWYGSQGAISERDLRLLGGAPYLSSIFYLSQEMPGGDLDLAVPALNESSNIFSFLRETCSRFERWQDLTSGAADISLAGPTEIDFLRRRKFIKVFWQLAAERGEVDAFLSALGGVLRLFNARLNMPETRLRLESGRFESLDMVLLSGTYTVLKDMVARFGQLG